MGKDGIREGKGGDMKKKTQIGLIYSIYVFIAFRLIHINSKYDFLVPFATIIIGQFLGKDNLAVKKNGLLYSLLLMAIVGGYIFYTDFNNIDYLTISKLADDILISVLAFIFFNYLIYE